MEKQPKALVPKVAKIQVLSAEEQISMALAKGANLAELKGLLELRKEFEAQEAKKAYHAAMAEFKKTPLKILKDKTVSFQTNAGTTKYNHATLANVVEKISAELSKHGLSASWVTHQEKDKTIKVTCRITHKQGHSEEASLEAMPDASGSKNSIQQIGSTVTYLERYTLLGLTGLATYDQDTDGKVSAKSDKQESSDKISEKEESELRDLMLDAEANEKAFIGLLKVDKLENLPKSKLDFAKKTLAGIKASHHQ